MYDVIVVGGGPGGYRVAELLGKSGKRVALIEKDKIGGVCLNQGCIPFKTFIHSGRILEEYSFLLHQGILSGSEVKINQVNLYIKKEDIINNLRKSVTQMLASVGVEIIYATAQTIVQKNDCFKVETEIGLFEGKKLIFATGSCEKGFSNISESTNIKVLNSERMLELTEFPETIDIIGGGAIGLEAASFFSGVGCHVAIIEASEHIGGQIDPEISKAAYGIFKKKGIEIFTETLIVEIKDNEVLYQKNGECFSRKPNSVLISIGRVPCIDENLLKSIGVAFNNNGIEIDKSCATSNPNVYACGDITGKLMLAHTAYRQAKVISDSINGKKCTVNYECIPRLIFSEPQVVSVGMSEEDCKIQNIQHESKLLPMTYSGKYFAEHGKDGAKAKMIVDSEKRVIGIHLIGKEIAELAHFCELIVMNHMSTEDISSLTFAHPTYGEIIAELVNSYN